MIVFEIADQADQKFATTLNGKRVSFRLRYNPVTDRWAFDLSVDGEAMLHGRRIVTGTDLLASYNFGVGLIFALPERDLHSAKFVDCAATDFVKGISSGGLAEEAEPDRDALPTGRVKLYSAMKEEVDAAMAA